MQFPSLDQLRRDARRLKTAYEAGDAAARQRVAEHPPRGDLSALKLADFLHVLAQEHFFESWPRLKAAADLHGLDRAARQQRLKVALAHGQTHVVQRLMEETPDLADGLFGLLCALYQREKVSRMLDADPGLATRKAGPRSPILHLAFSKWLQVRPDLRDDMLAVADLLLRHGADVNDSDPVHPGSDHRLSALYGAIGHAGNMALGRWLLDHGADPNDGESLYHATELGHHEGLRMLLDAGANPRGTNALLRAMDFHDHAAVEMLLAHGARADDFDPTPVGGEDPWTVPALHQAARRGSDARMIALLLDNGADPARAYQGASAYGWARVYGNTALARAIEARGAATALTPEEDLLAAAAEARPTRGRYIDPGKLPKAYCDIVRILLHLPGRLDHLRRLVAVGVEYDRPDDQGLTPVQIAGWEGLPEVMAWLISLKPDLSHVNGYGGTLLATIIHGSENNPDRAGRDYLTCLELALLHGVALPRQAIAAAGREDVADFLSRWAQAHPGQVV